MKRTLLALAFLAAPAHAVSAEAQKACSSVGSLAEAIMKGRQSGVPLSAMLSKVDSSDPAAEAARQIIITAFDVPRFSTPSMQQRAVEDRRDLAEKQCFKAFAKR